MNPVEAPFEPGPERGLFESAREATTALAEELQCLLDQAAGGALAAIDATETASSTAQGEFVAILHQTGADKRQVEATLAPEIRDYLHTASTSGDTPARVPAPQHRQRGNSSLIIHQKPE